MPVTSGANRTTFWTVNTVIFATAVQTGLIVPLVTITTTIGVETVLKTRMLMVTSHVSVPSSLFCGNNIAADTWLSSNQGQL